MFSTPTTVRPRAAEPNGPGSRFSAASVRHRPRLAGNANRTRIHHFSSTSFGDSPVIRTLCALICLVPSLALAQETVAEKSDYKATSRHADVVAFCEELAKKSPNVQQTLIGKSGEGRDLPMLIL